MSRAGTSLMGHEHLHFACRRRKLPVQTTFEDRRARHPIHARVL
jgi:hypothetical protein